MAWVYRTGDYGVGEGAVRSESTPLFVDGTLFLTTPFGRVIALDPDTGRERWSFDPRVDLTGEYGDFANRGVSTWVDPQTHARRVFIATIDSRLIALDAISGKPLAGFGVNGEVRLDRDLTNAPRWKGEYEITSPPAILHDLVIVGSSIGDNNRTDAPSGVVRAYDARTGALRWKWDPLPATDKVGAANAWSVFSVDEARDLVFIPTGSPSPDFYGGERPGDNRFANSVVALRGATGEIVWQFQVVHHDLWDYDVPAQPVLADWSGKPAVLVTTKMGSLFILDRETGKPLLPLDERAVPKSDVPGEQAWPTQPFTSNPPLSPQTLKEVWGMNDADRDACRAFLAPLRNEGMFTPPSLQGTLIFPGNIGGANWSALSVDSTRGLIVVPTNRVATVVTVFPREQIHDVHRAAPDVEIGSMRGTPFAMKRDWLLTKGHVPCNPPPWGALTAVDLTTGAIRWEVPLGYFPHIQNPDRAKWGSVNLGGAITTASGLAFIAATFDQHLRAFDVDTGRELWSGDLPAGGQALPMTYVSHGKQFVVITAGGHERLHTKLGDYLVAYSLSGGQAILPVQPLAGTWRGDIVPSGHERFPVELQLNEDAQHNVTGELRGGFAGPLTGTRTGNTINYRIDFSFPGHDCKGTWSGKLDFANDGNLLIGELTIEDECAGRTPLHVVKPAVLALRR